MCSTFVFSKRMLGEKTNEKIKMEKKIAVFMGNTCSDKQSRCPKEWTALELKR